MTEFFFEHIDSFFWSLGAFVVFVLIIFKFLLRPVVTALDKRDEKIKADLDQAAEARSKAERIQAELDEQLRGAEAKIAELMAEARRGAERQKEEILAAGREEVETLRQRSLREIDEARHQAVVAVRAELAEVATMVAEQILDKNLDAQAHQDLVGAAIASYEKQR